jgi:hypothetical protein
MRSMGGNIGPGLESPLLISAKRSILREMSDAAGRTSLGALHRPGADPRSGHAHERKQEIASATGAPHNIVDAADLADAQDRLTAALEVAPRKVTPLRHQVV